MTVSYSAEVASCTAFGRFLFLLARWRGSIYKLIWTDLIWFLSLYYMLSLYYHFGLDKEQKHLFESTVEYCKKYSSVIPLSFVLGFYVTIIMKRWWDQYMSLPWPDPIAVYVSALIRGHNEHSRKMRRTIMRYVCLSLTMVLTGIAPSVKKRFPALDHLVEAGLLVESEMDVIKGLNEQFPKHPKYWMPIVWASSIATRARSEGIIWDDVALRTIIDALNMFREQCAMIIHFDTISMPLVYTQVVTLAVYSYFICAVMGQQWTEKSYSQGYIATIDYFFPLFLTLQFSFFMGWLKVAESLMSPFGEDDDDYELNWLIDRNLQVSYLIADEMHNAHPHLRKDQNWEASNDLPYGDGDINRNIPDTTKFEFTRGSTTLSSLTSKLFEKDVKIFWKRNSNIGNTTSLQSTSSPISSLLRHFANKNINDNNEQDSSSDVSQEIVKQSSVMITTSPHTVNGYNVQLPGENLDNVEDFAHYDSVLPILNKEKQNISPEELHGKTTSNYKSSSFETAQNIVDEIKETKSFFELLKEQREKERLERKKQKVAATLANATSAIKAEITSLAGSMFPIRSNTISPGATTIIPKTQSIKSVTIKKDEDKETEKQIDKEEEEK